MSQGTCFASFLFLDSQGALYGEQIVSYGTHHCSEIQMVSATCEECCSVLSRNACEFQELGALSTPNF
jgi:hypothetical protein